MSKQKIEPCSNSEACNAQGCINPAGRCEEAAAAPQVPVKLPKWIDDKKGSDPLVDDLIAYIEQHAAPQVVAESALVMASKQALEYIEGVAARTDKNAVWERCEAICSDLRAALLGKPQVVADERAAFEEWAKAEGLIQESFGIRSTNSMCDVALKAWTAGRAALAAAPVQASETIARLEQELAVERAALAYAVRHVGNLKERQRAPVQPVAVPDDEGRSGLFNEERFAHMLNRLSVANRREGWTTNDPWKDREHLKRASDSVAHAEKEIRDYIVSLLAAPAAQGDALTDLVTLIRQKIARPYSPVEMAMFRLPDGDERTRLYEVIREFRAAIAAKAAS